MIVKSLLFRGARSSCYFKPRWVWPRVLLLCDPSALSSAGDRRFTASLHIHLVLWRFLPIAINPSDSNQSHYPLTPHRMWFFKILFVFGNTEVFKKFLRSKSSQSIIKKCFPSLMSLGVLPNPLSTCSLSCKCVCFHVKHNIKKLILANYWTNHPNIVTEYTSIFKIKFLQKSFYTTRKLFWFSKWNNQ